MHRFVLALVLLTALHRWPGTPPVQSANCTFQLGFAALYAQLPGTIGDCLENEQHNPANGDALQHTSNGLLVWRKDDNFTAFTDGYRSWIAGPCGVVQRLNSQRFPWEANPDGSPVIAGPTCASAAEPGRPTVVAPAPLDAPTGVVEDIADDVAHGVNLDAEAARIADSGAGWVRLDFRWTDIEPVRPMVSAPQFDRYNSIVATLRSHGLHILGLVDSVPPWANGRAAGPWMDTYPPQSGDDWSAFVGLLAGHYRGEVDAWELWNEENFGAPNAGFYRPAPDPTGYLSLLRAGHNAIKKADPQAIVVLGGLAGNGVDLGGSNIMANYLPALYAAGAKGVFDVVAIHPYLCPAGQADLADQVARLQSAVAATRQAITNGQDTATIWITEIGWASNLRCATTLSPTDIAAWLSAVYGDRCTMGVQRIFWNRFRDGNGAGGLVDTQLVPHPAFSAFQAIARTPGCAPPAVPPRRPSGVGQTIGFAQGEAVVGYRIDIDGRSYSDCYFPSAPNAGSVTDGVVNPWPSELRPPCVV